MGDWADKEARRCAAAWRRDKSCALWLEGHIAVALRAARRQALEEAERVCRERAQQHMSPIGQQRWAAFEEADACADAIRGLAR
jgi:hypothetical protein